MRALLSLLVFALWLGSAFAAGPVGDFPGGKTNATEQGVLKSLTGTDPAAGSEISETVPTGKRWRLVSFVATLVTNANVADRLARLLIDDGTSVFFVSTPNAVSAASVTERYQTGGVTANISVSATEELWPYAVPLLLKPGWRIRTSTASLQAGDNWGAPQYLVEEWLEP